MNKEAKECEAEEDAKVNKSMKVFQPNDSAQLSHRSKHANYKHEIRIFKNWPVPDREKPERPNFGLDICHSDVSSMDPHSIGHSTGSRQECDGNNTANWNRIDRI